MSQKWICLVCGYVHKGAAPPEACPSCGAPRTAFELRVLNPAAKFRKIGVVEERPSGFRYVIIGNSSTGRTAAFAITHLDHDGQVTLITEEPDPFYARPMLPDYLGGVPRGDLFGGSNAYEPRRAELVLGERVVQIDRAGRKVLCASGREFEYDALLLATGSEPRRLQWPGSDCEGIGYLRSLADAEQFVGWLDGARRAVVVGGGLLGLELVRAFVMRGLPTTLLVRGTVIGAPALDEVAGAILERALREAGVEVALEEEVESFEARDGRVVAVNTTKGRTVEADVVGVAVGAVARKELAEAAGLQCERGVLVDRRMRTSDPAIYAAGDVAQAWDRVWGEQRVNTSWRLAREQGEYAGIFMAGGEGEYPGAVAANYQLAAGVAFCTLGISNPPEAEGFEIEVSGGVDEGVYRKLVRVNGRLVGACLVGTVDEAVELEKELRESEASGEAGPVPPPASKPQVASGAAEKRGVGEEESSEESQSEGDDMRKMTKENLEASFAGESQAHVKYLNFAEKAAEEGKENVARLFRAASFAEQVHASRHLDVLEGVGNTSENLAEAMAGEQFEVEEMYPAYMAVAEEQEEAEAYQTFERAARAEQVHYDLYSRAKQVVDEGNDAELGTIQVCSYCGWTLEGDAPDKCPVCGAPKSAFVAF
ncbi:MAG: FAD-dependent oxidoreductase [Armatimonadetes bacterium]|nr:FAD-dependent oxidoreductase [Armatimonadota bacterium]